jgi:glycyl-tRNA synthetase
VPYVVETSVGFNRTFWRLSAMDLKTKNWKTAASAPCLALPAFLAPIKIAVFPLMKKDGLPEKAREIFDDLKWDYKCFYEEKDAIGKRYRRMDAIGTPFCVTVDHQTMEDNTVTLRDRDTMQQERVSLDQLKAVVAEKVDWRKGLR